MLKRLSFDLRAEFICGIYIFAEKSDKKMSLKKKEANVAVAPLAKKKNPFIKDLTTNYNLYLMILPCLILFVLFYYMPMYGVIISFKDYDMLDGIMGSPWVGFDHFTKFFQSHYFWRLVRNTLSLGFLNMIWNFFPPIILAILMNEAKNIPFKKTVQTVTYLPYFVPIVVVVGMMQELLGATGVINNLAVSLGFNRTLFLDNPALFKPLYIATDIWQRTGWGTIVYMAALAGVDQQLYEAAYLDGANRFQRIWHISIPGILPTITIMLILNAAQVVNVGYEKVYLMQTPTLYEASDVINTFVYREALSKKKFDYGTAIGLLNSVAATLIMVVTNKTVDKLNGTALW